MSVLLFSEADVRRFLPMPDAIRLMRSVFEKLASGEAQNQPRRRLALPSGSVLHQMAGAYGNYFGTKIYSTNPGHGAHFAVLLYRAEDGEPLALMEANYLGQIRTGAVSGLATASMARPNAQTVGLIGSGFQACSQLEAVLAVRPIRHVRVWSRNAEKRQSFAQECAAAFGLPVEAAESAEAAVREADIVITATNARNPVVEAGWIAPGTHINAIGSNHPKRRELPAELVRAAELIAVDSVEQAKLESGDLLLALGDEDWRSPRIAELADIVSGKHKEKTRPGAITIFKSNGLGVEDVAAAGHIYELGVQAGAREVLPLFHS